MNIAAIEPEYLVYWWPKCRPGLEEMLHCYSNGDYSEDDILERLTRGEWQLFLVLDDDDIIASLVCVLNDTPTGRVFEVGMCWGRDADHWTADIYEAFSRIGKDMGCSRMSLNGRPGWRKLARSLGFKINSVTFGRDL
ncbi:MAG: hypothetical protein ACR2P6_07585 [Gammaproteobacteria bacterium]